MRVWTVQPLIVWDRLQEARLLQADPVSYYDGYTPWQYQWIVSQLRKRVPGYDGGFPWWAYCEKPDLRWVRHHRPSGQQQVRIEVNPDNMITFPSWAWDVIHSGHFLAFTKREQDAWTKAMRRSVPNEDLWPLPEPWRSELEASWLRLFEPALPMCGWLDACERPNPNKEAVFETLRLGDVKSVTHFVGRSRFHL